MTDRILTIIVVLAILVLMFSGDDRKIIQSTEGCCAIVVVRSDTDEYLVTWVDNLSSDTYTELVEVEFPEAGVPFGEQLKFELDWTINEFMDICYREHGRK